MSGTLVFTNAFVLLTDNVFPFAKIHCVQVAIYDDRVEITSPGMLYGGLTIEQIKEGVQRFVTDVSLKYLAG